MGWQIPEVQDVHYPNLPKKKRIGYVVRIGSIIIFHGWVSDEKASSNTVWCYISGEAVGKVWNWSLLGVKGLIVTRSYWPSKPSCGSDFLVMWCAYELFSSGMWVPHPPQSAFMGLIWNLYGPYSNLYEAFMGLYGTYSVPVPGSFWQWLGSMSAAVCIGSGPRSCPMSRRSADAPSRDSGW